VAALSAGYVETSAGRYDDAFGHVQAARDLAERFGYPWPAAWSRVLQGTLAAMRGQLDQARTLLDEALELSSAVSNTRNATLCLVAFARLALQEGDPQRAALLVGAVEGLRQRAGLGAWPMLRRGKLSWSPRSGRPWAPSGSTR
jgi:ATP/maltotriose-dependent transcriptional regulator MalT